MDEVPEHEPYKPVLASKHTQVGYSLEGSSKGLTSGLYFDESLEKGLGIDTSSIFYYELNGGLDSSASGKGMDECKYGSLDKMLSQDLAADLVSATGLSNASKDYCWDIDFPKKVPDVGYQFRGESGLGNSNLVSQSSGTNKEAVGASDSASQIEYQNDQLGMLITCENYMNSFVREMLMNNEVGLNSSSSCGLKDLVEANNVASSVETSESYHCRKKGYFGGFHDLNPPGMSCTSQSMQCSDATPVDEDTKADDCSLQGVLIEKPADCCDPQVIDKANIVASPVDTSESYHHRNEGYISTSHDFNPFGASCTSVSEQCSSDASPVDEETEAYDPSSQGVLINKPTDSCDIQDIGEHNDVASTVDTGESFHHMTEGYVGTYHEFNSLGVSCTSTSMQCSDASAVYEDAEVDDPSLQGVLINKAAGCCDLQDIAEGNDIASPVETSDSYHQRNEGYLGTSHDLNPQGLSCTSHFMQCTDASPMVEDTEEDDPSLQGVLINKPAECRKVEVCIRQKRVRKPNQRCTSDSPDFKSRRLRRRKDESTSYSKNKHFEPKAQKRYHRKRTKDDSLVAKDVLARRSSEQDLDSDEEYDPSHSNFKLRRSKKGSDRRKNNNLWSLSEVIKLVDGISEFGVGKWTAIQRSFFGSSPYRTSLDLRDKWRNLLRTSLVRLQNVKEEEGNAKNGSMPFPKSLLERIRELDSVHPYPRSDVKLTSSCRRELTPSLSK